MSYLYDLTPDIPENIWSTIVGYMEAERFDERPSPYEYGATSRMELFQRFCEWHIDHYGE